MHASLPRLAIGQTYLVSMVINIREVRVSSITCQRLDGLATPKSLITIHAIIAEQIWVFSDPTPFHEGLVFYHA